MSAARQHDSSPAIAAASLRQAVEVAEAKYREDLARPHSEREMKFATRGLAAIQKFKSLEVCINQ